MLTMDWIQYSLLTIDTLIIITTYEKSVIVIPIFRDAETMTYERLYNTYGNSIVLPFISDNRSVLHFFFNYIFL